LPTPGIASAEKYANIVGRCKTWWRVTSLETVLRINREEAIVKVYCIVIGFNNRQQQQQQVVALMVVLVGLFTAAFVVV
jgi:hypothetical protein